MPGAALVIGATRGLGRALVDALLPRFDVVYGTARSRPSDWPAQARLIDGVDVATPEAGQTIVDGLQGTRLSLVVYSAGVFPSEPSLDQLDWDGQLAAYKICAMGPAFCAAALHRAKAFEKGAILLVVTTEGGSISLRVPSEGGGQYGHHGSKAAENMVARLLSLDLTEAGVTVVAVHPGFMRTEMTEAVGFDSAWDEGGAVTPAEAAQSIVDFVPRITRAHSGQLWAPRGPRDIGTAKEVLGDDLPTPLQLPW